MRGGTLMITTTAQYMISEKTTSWQSMTVHTGERMEKETLLKLDVKVNYMLWPAFTFCLIITQHNKHASHKRCVRLTFSFILMQPQPFLPTSTPAASLIAGCKCKMEIPSKTITKTPCCHTGREASSWVSHFTDCPSCNNCTSSLSYA